MARLSTHILDSSLGVPAEGVAIELYRLQGGARLRVTQAVSNREGRTDEPLLSGNKLETGIYELMFFAGDYLRRKGVILPDPPFLDQVVIRFGIADGSGNYHVPLVFSPYGYSTYRGS